MLKNTKKLIKRSKMITQQPKAISNPNITEIKSVTTEHLKTSHKLSKTIKQAKKFPQVVGAGKKCAGPLYKMPS